MIETFALDRSFGGNLDRAHVDYNTLGETLLTLLGTSVCAGKKWFVVNGLKKRFHPGVTQLILVITYTSTIP
jgi:hypothetical protein